MSKGPGRIERAIADTFASNPTRIYTVETLATLAYPGTQWLDKKHRVATIRAANKVAPPMWWSWCTAGVPGGPLIYFNLCDVRSYTMAMTVGMGRVTYHDWWPSIDDWFDAACAKWRDDSEERLDRRLSTSFKLADMQPGGTWHDHVQIAVAERQGQDPPPDVQARQAARSKAAKDYLAMARAIGAVSRMPASLPELFRS